MSAQLLVRTPAPYACESLFGYVLRVSETNGYCTPWHVFDLAGISRNESITAGFPIDKLARVLGKAAGELRPHAYRAYTADGVREYVLMGHQLGRSLSWQPLRLQRPAICCMCIEETGYVDACWDLSAFSVCPSHLAPLVGRCHSCGQGLSWNRPGLLTCKCGANLSYVPAQAVDGATAALMEVIQSKVHRVPLDRLANAQRLPMQWLDSIPLMSLLKILEIISRRAGALTFPGHESMSIAAGVLANWPKGFHAFLDKLGAQSTLSSLGLRSRFSNIYQALFKNDGVGANMEFMRNEFIRYGVEHGEDSVVSQRTKGAENYSLRYVSVSDLAKRLGVRRSTASGWADKGLVRSKIARTAGGQQRFVVDTEGLDTTARDIGRIFCERRAACYIGLPAAVLRAIRSSECYSSDPVVNQRRGFWKTDLDRLANRINSVTCAGAGESYFLSSISLRQVITRHRFGSANAKVELLKEILEGRIVPVARAGDSFLDLHFCAADIKKFRSKLLAVMTGDRITYQTAGTLIGCDRTALPALVRDGFLARPPGANRGVLRTTVDAFLAQWAPRKLAARQLNMSSVTLQRLVEEGGFRVLRFGKDCSGAIFVERAALQRLRSD